jgi:hypothetical protein
MGYSLLLFTVAAQFGPGPHNGTGGLPTLLDRLNPPSQSQLSAELGGVRRFGEEIRGQAGLDD